MQIQITGLEQVQTALKNAGPKLSRLAYLRALGAAGKVLQAEVQERAPVKTDLREGGNSLPPGALKSDIQVQVSSTDQGGQVKVGPSPKTAHVAYWIEFGYTLTSHGQKKGRKAIKHIPARPFLRPARDTVGEAAIAAFQNTLIENLSVLETPE